MNKIIEVKVTQTDIDKGKPGLPKKCAISRAIQRRIHAKRFKKEVSVCGEGGVSVGEITDYYSYNLLFRMKPMNEKENERVKKFIYNFDEGKKVKPTTFKFKVEDI
jgi:hypothetical protein